MRTVQILPARELTEQQQIIWTDLQASNPAVDSAFYTPDFARLVASVRSDAAVAIMGEDGETVGFFPFLRSSDGIRRSRYRGYLEIPINATRRHRQSRAFRQ